MSRQWTAPVICRRGNEQASCPVLYCQGIGISLALHAKRRCISLPLQFDKDDALAVEFVTASSNLRAVCYGITPQSLFDAKVG